MGDKNTHNLYQDENFWVSNLCHQWWRIDSLHAMYNGTETNTSALRLRMNNQEMTKLKHFLKIRKHNNIWSWGLSKDQKGIWKNQQIFLSVGIHSTAT
jgi:hypothetical protein